MTQDWKVYINGKIVPFGEAKISVFDMGFQYGDGVFEGIRCYAGKIFKLDQHIYRLFDSARAVDITIPLSFEEIKQAIKDTFRANAFKNAHIKFIVTRGNALLPGGFDKKPRIPNIVGIVRPIEESMYGEKGKSLRLAVSSVRKIPAACIDPRIKSLNYMINFLARSEAQVSGADDAIMLDLRSYISEGTGFNVFLVRDRALWTPTVQSALQGITRQTVIEMAKEVSICVYETDLSMYNAYTADEIFVTGSGAGIVPVVEIDKKSVGSGEPGPITQQIIQLYREAVQTGEPFE